MCCNGRIELELLKEDHYTNKDQYGQDKEAEEGFSFCSCSLFRQWTPFGVSEFFCGERISGLVSAILWQKSPRPY